MSDWIIKDDELYHYGVKGMKWGKRRKVYPSGTITTYSKNGKRITISSAKTIGEADALSKYEKAKQKRIKKARIKQKIKDVFSKKPKKKQNTTPTKSKTATKADIARKVIGEKIKKQYKNNKNRAKAKAWLEKNKAQSAAKRGASVTDHVVGEAWRRTGYDVSGNKVNYKKKKKSDKNNRYSSFYTKVPLKTRAKYKIKKALGKL